MSVSDSEIKSGHSLDGFAEVISRPVALTLPSFDKSERTRDELVFTRYNNSVKRGWAKYHDLSEASRSIIFAEAEGWAK